MDLINFRELMNFLGCTTPITVGPRIRHLVAKYRKGNPFPTSYLGVWRLPSDLRLTKPQQ